MAKELGERARRTREHILAQGMALMQERGFRDTTIRDICEAAEVSVGTFYSYFKDKGELFRYNFQAPGPEFANFLHENISGETAREQIFSFVRYYAWLNIGTGQKELERIFLQLARTWHDNRNPAYGVLYEIVVRGQKNGEVLSDQDPAKIVDTLRVFLRGCVYEWLIQGCAFDLETTMLSYIGQLIDSYLIK